MPASLATHDFGSQLKYLRKRAHLTQRDLARAGGSSRAALACGAVETSRQIAQAVVQAAREKGLKQLEQVAQALLSGPERPPHELPRIILVGPEN